MVSRPTESFLVGKIPENIVGSCKDRFFTIKQNSKWVKCRSRCFHKQKNVDFPMAYMTVSLGLVPSPGIPLAPRQKGGKISKNGNLRPMTISSEQELTSKYYAETKSTVVAFNSLSILSV